MTEITGLSGAVFGELTDAVKRSQTLGIIARNMDENFCYFANLQLVGFTL